MSSMASSKDETRVARKCSEEDLLLTLWAYSAQPANAEELGNTLDDLILQSQSDTKLLIAVAHVLASNPLDLACIPIKRLCVNSQASNLAWLTLLKIALQDHSFKVPEAPWFVQSITSIKACLLELQSTDASLAIEICCLLVQCGQEDYNLDVVKSVKIIIWQSIRRNILDDQKSSSHIFKAWIRWLKSPHSLRPDAVQIESHEYRSCIQAGLLTGSQELQKLSLFILRQSAAIWQQSSGAVENLAKHDVNHYCRAFETIYMSGYPVQALECLGTLDPELLILTTSSADRFAIDGPWWTLLASATLAWSRSDSTKKDLGYWVLRHKFVSIPYTNFFGVFVSERLLPWACQGTLFHAKVRRAGTSATCKHGNELATFVQNLLDASENVDARDHYLDSILKSFETTSTSPYALAYILHGLASHLKQHQDVPVTVQATILNLSSIIKGLPLTKGQRRVIEKQIATIRGLVHSGAAYTLSDQAQILPIREFYHISTDQSSSMQSIFQHDVEQAMLSEAYERIALRLRHEDSSLASQLAREDGAAFTYLWSESSRQRHPKAAVTILPQIFLSQAVIAQCQVSKPLRETVLKFVADTFKLAQTRVYVWTPMTREIYNVYSSTMLHGKWFMDLIKDLIMDFVKSPPSPALDYLLECSISDLLDYELDKSVRTHPVQLDEGLGHAYLFSVLNHLKEADLEHGRNLILQLLKPWQKVSAKMVDKSKSEYALQAVVILAFRCLNTSEDVFRITDLLQKALHQEKSPRYRFLLEFATVICYWHFEDAIENYAMETLIDSFFTILDDNVSPRFIVTQLRLCVSVARHPSVTSLFLESLLSWIPTLVASPRIVIRFETLYTVLDIMKIASERGFKAITTNLAYVRLDEHAQALLKAKSHYTTRKMEAFDSTKDQCLAVLFEGAYLQLENHPAGPISANNFQIIHSESPSMIQAGAMPIGTCTSGFTNTDEIRSLSTFNAASPNIDTNYQSKSFAIPDKDLEIVSVPVQKKNEVILIATLIDTPVNVGGLCRAAEIYGCSELHVSNISMTADRGFLSTSVSSESHISILQTRPTELRSYLTVKRLEGFTILGVEQTESSIELGAEGSKLPNKIVVVMGAERTGIPADTLIECDVCVEIKQWGVTRSLNVQTAAATLLYEWRRQHG